MSLFDQERSDLPESKDYRVERRLSKDGSVLMLARRGEGAHDIAWVEDTDAGLRDLGDLLRQLQQSKDEEGR